MKQLIIRNLILSGCLMLCVYVSQSIFQQKPHKIVYYLSVLFYMSIYLIQAIIIKKNQSNFVMFYNLTTLVKMILSMLFLVAYYYLTSHTITENIIFSTFFMFSYFFYLFFNVKALIPHQ